MTIKQTTVFGIDINYFIIFIIKSVQSIPFLEAKSLSARYSLSFMEPEGSLPFSQEPAVGLYPESDEPSTHRHTLFP
jgi:hypothetical protein